MNINKATPMEAMSFIHNHCLKYHHLFSRNLVKIYAPHVQVLDVPELRYVQLSEVDKKVFNTCFSKCNKQAVFF